MRKATIPVLAMAIGAIALAGCADPDQTGDDTPSGSLQSAVDVIPYGLSSVEKVDEIAAMVPEAVKKAGVLRNGASTDYAPGEFRAADGQTPVGYDVDLVNAIAKVMGLEKGETTHAEFPTIIPALGSKFDVGASSFTITPERLRQVHMVSYVEVGSAYAVAKGNPKSFDAKNVCGKTIGVQNGTYQQDYADKLSEECVAAGKEKIRVMPHDLQSDVATKVIGGQYDATLADSTVIGYAVKLSGGELEQIGDVIESAPQGIAVAKNDEQLAKAVQAAVQHLMDDGTLTRILAPYGAESAALTKAELDPAQ
ncbi:ABC transporter substrate-binding protein [Schaalia sp. 19OD2882]|uniref:ABC transporter substrate-binding protein n=1 Tax=Schaalia sp. 19OD2882 TaxID=2794089 RepID=UPI001C1EAA8F|nr:ABC transporter substrate-binding protein [Schaalia sp. 19OD2882]QWW18744.1 ABC transporter substrate-binding protein [Schaalia sp. 19OD2882]